MADRVLRGSRLGAVSYETDRDHDLAPRRIVQYRTDNGEIFDVPFADDAEVPSKWPCKNGMEGTILEGAEPEEKKTKPPRTHWDMLLERRSEEELEVLLNERLDLLKLSVEGSEFEIEGDIINLSGTAVRVPTQDGSLVDLTATLDKKVTAAEVNAAIRKAATRPACTPATRSTTTITAKVTA